MSFRLAAHAAIISALVTLVASAIPSLAGQAATARTPAAPQAADSRAITLQAALDLADRQSFTVRQFDARVSGAAARLTGAGKLMNPVGSIGGHVGKDAAGTDEDIVLSQTFELGDKLRQRVRVAGAERDTAAFDRQEALNDLHFTVKSAYFEAARADAAQNLAQAALDNAKRFAETAQVQFTAGDVPHTQVTRSRLEQSRAEQLLAAAKAERANRFATLASLVHLSQDVQPALADPLTFAPAAYDLQRLRTYAAVHRPDLQSVASARAGKLAQLHSARAQSQPDLFIEARHSDIDPATGGSTLRFGILFPIIDFGRVRADAASARAAVAEQDALADETRRTALLEVDTAFRNLAAARATIESFQADRLAQSRELVDLAQIGYSSGANTFLELLDAQQVYRNEQTDYTRALADYNIALAALEHAVGGRLP